MKQGLPTAAVLAGLGFVLAELSSIWMQIQSPPRMSADESWIWQTQSKLRWQLPLGMAAWGFGLVAIFEAVVTAIRGGARPSEAEPESAAENSG